MMDALQFNACLARVDQAVNEPVSAELAAAYERIGQLERSLHNARLQLEYLDERFPRTGSTSGVVAQIDAVLNDGVAS